MKGIAETGKRKKRRKERKHQLTWMNAFELCDSSENALHERNAGLCVMFVKKFWQETVE